MAEACGLAVSTVQSIWKAHGLAPHRWRSFKLSTDPAFAEKLHDIVGLYVDPPAHAVVLSVDEKSQIQALDRTQPGLPMKKGRMGTMTHDYKRHGTTTLFAALNVLDGTVIGKNMARHRHQEFIRFLNALEREIPQDKAVHAIIDNYAAHKTPQVRRWLARHPRWTFHFTPTSSSWLNAVEGFFAKLFKRRLKRGVFCSLVELQAAINRFVAEHNQSPKPFVWRADPDAIIAARATRVPSVGVEPLVSPAYANYWANKGDWDRFSRQEQNGYVMGAMDQFGFIDFSGNNRQHRLDLLSCLNALSIDSYALVDIVNRQYTDLANWEYPPNILLVQGLEKVCHNHINRNRDQRGEAPLP